MKGRLLLWWAVFKQDSTRKIIHRFSGSLTCVAVGSLWGDLYWKHNDPLASFIMLAVFFYIFFITDLE